MDRVESYTGLASFMGRYPEMRILRRFGRLNMQNLLYLQAELVQLGTELQEMEGGEEEPGNPHQQFYAQDWRMLSNHFLVGDNDQYKKVLEIRKKLREYSEYIWRRREPIMLDTLGCIFISSTRRKINRAKYSVH